MCWFFYVTIIFLTCFLLSYIYLRELIIIISVNHRTILFIDGHSFMTQMITLLTLLSWTSDIPAGYSQRFSATFTSEWSCAGFMPSSVLTKRLCQVYKGKFCLHLPLNLAVTKLESRRLFLRDHLQAHLS